MGFGLLKQCSLRNLWGKFNSTAKMHQFTLFLTGRGWKSSFLMRKLIKMRIFFRKLKIFKKSEKIGTGAKKDEK